jgi:ABC-type transporter Mla subunit MlaD
MTRGLVVATLLTAIAVGAAGCGGGDESASTTTPAEWADGFCTSVTTWTDELQRISDEFGDPSSASLDSLKQAANEVETATDAFLEDVRNLGAPETDSGQAVEDSLQTLADTVESEKADLKAAAEDVSDLSGVAAAVTAIGTSLNAMGTAFQQALTAIQNADTGGELETAFEQTDSCNELASLGS